MKFFILNFKKWDQAKFYLFKIFIKVLKKKIFFNKH